MVLKTPNGKRVQGVTPTEILEDLHKQSRGAQPLDKTQYLRLLTMRINEFYGIDFQQYDDDLTTFGILVAVGYLDPE